MTVQQSLSLRHLGQIVLAVLIALFSPDTAQAAKPPTHCEFSAADQAWAAQAVEAWRLTSQTITKIHLTGKLRMVLFSSNCTRTSDDAIAEVGPVTWSSVRHGKAVSLPDGHQTPVGVISYSKTMPGGGFFVMSVPSVWRAKGVDGGPLGLEKLMTAVLIHESAHLAQSGIYFVQFARLAERYSLPETFNDDSIQERFRTNKEFADTVKREIDLLFAASAAPNDMIARHLAQEAQQLILMRRARWFTGPDAGLSEAEDLWLTLEGSGQWAGYSWLTSPSGAGLPTKTVISGFARRGGWWTQDEGLAMLLVVDRLAGPEWRFHAFGDGVGTSMTFLSASLKH